MTNELATRNGVEIDRSTTMAVVVNMVLDSLHSESTRRAYSRALNDFTTWAAENADGFNRRTVNAYVSHLRSTGASASSVNQRLSAIRKLASEAAENGLVDFQTAASIQRIKGVAQRGTRAGNWLTLEQAQAMLRRPDTSTLVGLRDRAILAVALGCGLRRKELATLTIEHIQQREGRWAIVDIVGKRNKVRTIPMPSWVKHAVDCWTVAAGITDGHVFRPIRKGDNLDRGAKEMTAQSVYVAICRYAPDGIAPHDLRRTFAKLAKLYGGAIEQISIVMGHDSTVTTQKYFGLEIDYHNSPGDAIPLSL